jgi:hypothetical protein
MNTVEQLDRWLAEGELSADEHATLSTVASGRRLSVYVELNAALYLGVLAFAAGLAWTARTYAAQWSDAAILGPATALLAVCFYYCYSRVPAYSHAKVAPPGLAFDYVLYLGCLICAIELGYIEYRFQLLNTQWDYYLLASAVLYLALAYRFDNRFVLSLGVATLGAWFGVRIVELDFFVAGPVRLVALVYGVVVGVLGFTLYQAGIKRHFLETYAHVATNLVLGAPLSGVIASQSPSLWTLGLIAAAAGAIAAGVHGRRFSFVVYGVIYGYIGLLRELLREVPGITLALFLIVVSAAGVVVGLVVLSRRFGREQ